MREKAATLENVALTLITTVRAIVIIPNIRERKYDRAKRIIIARMYAQTVQEARDQIEAFKEANSLFRTAQFTTTAEVQI